MGHYFYSDGKSQFGPFSKEELKRHNINRNTLVWYEGLNEWKKAEELEELNDLFQVSPPPIPANLSNKPNPKKKKRWLVPVIIISLIAVLVGVGIEYYPDIEFYFEQREEGNRKARQLESERSAPILFLNVERAALTEKLFSFVTDKAEIEGTIKNNATMTKYKDIKLDVYYYSKTKTVIKTEHFVIYEYISPNSYLPFKIEVEQPENYSSFEVRVLGATTVY